MGKDENVDDLEVYNLEKLKWVFWGMIIPLVINIIVSIIGGEFLGGKIINGLVQIVGLVMIIWGLKEISKYSSRFETAYKCGVISFLIVIGLVVGVLISIAGLHSFFGGIMFICFIALFVIIGVEICFYYSLLKGIEEISRQLGEEDFANKIDKFWYTFIWTGIAAVFIMILSPIAFPSLGTYIIIIMTIVVLVVNLMLCRYIYKAYKLLDGRKIPTEPVTCNVAALE